MRRPLTIVRNMLLMIAAAAVIAAGVVVWSGYDMYREALSRSDIAAVIDEARDAPGYTASPDLPARYLDAVVAIEDHRFYGHDGIDPIAICRAAWNDLRAWSLREGGSTITQQVAKNLFFSQEKRFTRKVAEAFMAFDLESRYTKDEILELYVNTSYFGRGCTGIGPAAEAYLGKLPKDMTDYECTYMAGIPNAPNALAEDADRAQERQRIVVGQMKKYGFEVGEAEVPPAEGMLTAP